MLDDNEGNINEMQKKKKKSDNQYRTIILCIVQLM